ncbi:MAG: AAA family ATPase [Acidimicrobiales bacterium]
MTTENVAVLFTDIVDSTALSQRLTPDGADDVRRAHFSTLRQAITEAGGTEVKNLGDGVMVVFGSASAALACGVAMQQGVERDNRDRDDAMGLRVGVSGGEVTREDDDYFGDPVVEAARLCAACRGGQVLAADVVRAMAGRRSRHEWRSVGDLALKGLPYSVETIEVLWEPLRDTGSASAVPLPRRLAVRPAVGVVGRESELAAIAATAKRAAAGEGRALLLVSGEPGLGKSTVVAEAARSAHADGACVLLGHAEEELATPYQLFTEALGHYVTHAPEEMLLDHVSAHGSELARLVPALSSRLPDLPAPKATDADTERFLFFAAVVGLLATISRDQLVVLTLDDLQWADEGSLALLRHLAASEQDMRLLVLGIYRDSELAHTDALRDALGVLRRQSGVDRIELSGLDDHGVISFLESAAGQVLDDAGVGLAHAVYRETDGNPFFVGEVLRHLADTGAIHQDASGKWVAADSLEQIALPDSVREVIGGRVARLGKQAARILSMAAVIGRDFDLDLLALSSATTEDELLDILDEAAAVALVREMADTGRFTFAHALIQHTLYEDLGPNRRTRAHRDVALALEDLCRDRPGNRVGELARHWIAATQPIDLTKAITYSRQAGDAALEALAPADALRYYAQALDLYPQVSDPDPDLGLDLAIGLGTAQRLTGQPAYRETLLAAGRQAAALGETDRLVAAALANNRGLFSSLGVVDDEKVALLETVLDTMADEDSNERALLLATLCNELTHGRPLEERRVLAHSAKDMARRLDQPATIVQVLNLVGQPLEAPPTLQERLADTAQALVLAESLGDPSLQFFAAVYRRIDTLNAGDVETPAACLAVMRSLSDKLRQPILDWITTFHEGAQALLSGDHERAEVLATEALAIGTECGQPDAVSFYGTQLLIVRHQQGRLGELVPTIEAVASETGMSSYYNGALAAVYLDSGEQRRALELLDDTADDGFRSLRMGIGWLDGIIAFTEVAIELRASEPSRLLFDLLAPYHDQIAYNGLIPHEPVAMYLGALASVLGRYDIVEPYLDDASEFNVRAGATFATARTELVRGRMLADRDAAGDHDRARAILTAVRSDATERGFGTVERRAAAALSGLG